MQQERAVGFVLAVDGEQAVRTDRYEQRCSRRDIRVVEDEGIGVAAVSGVEADFLDALQAVGLEFDDSVIAVQHERVVAVAAVGGVVGRKIVPEIQDVVAAAAAQRVDASVECGRAGVQSVALRAAVDHVVARRRVHHEAAVGFGEAVEAQMARARGVDGERLAGGDVSVGHRDVEIAAAVQLQFFDTGERRRRERDLVDARGRNIDQVVAAAAVDAILGGERVAHVEAVVAGAAEQAVDAALAVVEGVGARRPAADVVAGRSRIRGHLALRVYAGPA